VRKLKQEEKNTTGEEEGVIKTANFGGKGAQKFPSSCVSPPEPSRRPQIRPRELKLSLALEK
jgi:hypothetical protein